MHAKLQICTSSMIHKRTGIVLVIVPIGTIFANICMHGCQRVTAASSVSYHFMTEIKQKEETMAEKEATAEQKAMTELPDRK